MPVPFREAPRLFPQSPLSEKLVPRFYPEGEQNDGMIAPQPEIFRAARRKRGFVGPGGSKQHQDFVGQCAFPGFCGMQAGLRFPRAKAVRGKSLLH
jgi:hypothetical protein